MWLFIRGGLVLLLWIAWLVYWRVSAADVKPAVRHESKWLRTSYVIPILIASIFDFHPSDQGFARQGGLTPG